MASLLTAAMASPAGATHGFEIIRTVAGGGTLEGDAADGQPATAAALSFPQGVVVDGAGNYYFIEGNRVRKVDANGIITTIAGNGEPGCGGDGGPATEAQVGSAQGLALDAAGNLYVAQEAASPGSCENRIRKIDTSGTITTFAGTTLGCSGDGGPATAAQIRPRGVFVDPAGHLYIADTGCGRVARVDTSGTITTVAGILGDNSFGGDGGPATQARLNNPSDVYVDSAGNLYIADTTNHRIRKVVPGADGVVTGAPDEIINTVVGSGPTSTGGFSGDGGPATSAQLFDPIALDFDPAGNLYIVDISNGRIRKVVPGADGQISGAPDEIITTFAGSGATGSGGDGSPPTQVPLGPRGVAAADPALGVLIADAGNNRIRQVINVPDLLSVTKAAGPNPVNAGEELTYTIEVANNGGPATGATVTDTLDPDVDFVSAEATQGSCTEAAGTVTCQLGDMAPDSGATVTIVVIPTVGGTATNTVTVDAAEDDPLPANNSASTETGVNAAGCGQVITADTILQSDIGPCQTDGIIVGADNITLHLNGHHIFGAPGPGNGDQAGIRLPSRTGVTITGKRGRGARGTVSGFDAGVFVNGGSRNTIANLVARDNIGPEGTPNLGDGIILFNSAFNRISSNFVTNNGIYDNIGVLGVGSDYNLIESNLVTDAVYSESTTVSGLGITTNPVIEGFTQGAQVFNNRIVNNTVRNNSAQGISTSSSTNLLISGNLVENNGLVNRSPGNGIGVRNNLQAPRMTSVRIEHNVIRGNDQGIEVLSDGNTVISNEIVGNTTWGLRSLGRNNEISRNKINQNGSEGIFLVTGRGNTVSTNEVIGNGRSGILAVRETNSRILRNEAHGNNRSGIELSMATGNQVRYNNAADNVLTDLRDSFPDCDNNVWVGNIWGSGGFSPPCVTNGGSGPPAPALAAAVSAFASAERVDSPPQTAENVDPPARRAPTG